MSIQTMISTEAANNFGALIEYAIKGGATVVERYKRPTAVVIGYEEWSSLRKLHAELLAQRSAAKDIPWEDAKEQLIRDGLIDD